VREQVDDADEERHEQREEEELDRPAAYDAAADPEEARRPPVELEPLVERSHELLGRPAERRQPRAVEALRVVAERRRRALAARRERDRGYAARDERPLPVQRERKAEVDQLAEDRGTLGRARLLGDAAGRRRDEERRCGARRVARDDESRPAGTGEGREVDDGDDLVREPLREARRAEPAERRAVRREEDERVRRPHAPGRRSRRRLRVAACE